MSGGDGTKTVTSELDHTASHGARPEILIVTRRHVPACDAHYPQPGVEVKVGRSRACSLALDDDELSNEHFSIRHLEGHRWAITDHGSKNGTFVNGVGVRGTIEHEAERIFMRAGGTVIVLCHFDGLLRVPPTVSEDGFVRGSALTACHHMLANYAVTGLAVLIQGESGSGKEEAARVVHRAGKKKRGPFVALNCSDIVESLAESLLFGVKKGAVTGVAESQGYFAEADGGTLFLDEIHTLSRALQPKLLRTLQDGTLRIVGGGERKVDVQLVCATNVNLRAAVAAGAFGQDLYMRIAGAVVDLPPLRARPEEVPSLIARRADDMRVHADFVEACLLRPWPGNVRELLDAVTAAVAVATAAQKTRLRASHLRGEAGTPIVPVVPAPPPRIVRAEPARVKEPADPRWAIVKEQYLLHRSAAKAADMAGVPRGKAHRWLTEAGLIQK